MGYQEPISRRILQRGNRHSLPSLQELLRGSRSPVTCEAVDRADLVRLGKALLKMRRIRESLFGKDLFADPAWDMLLDLFVCQLEGRRVTISSACIAATAPQTTGLRHLRILESRGFIHRIDDRFDRRRSYVELTRPAFDLMLDLLDSHRAAICS